MTPRLAPAAMGSEKVADAISRDAISEATATASGIPVVSTTAGSVAAPLFGGFAPGYFDNGYGGQQPLYIQQNVATSANAYSIVDYARLQGHPKRARRAAGHLRDQGRRDPARAGAHA